MPLLVGGESSDTRYASLRFMGLRLRCLPSKGHDAPLGSPVPTLENSAELPRIHLLGTWVNKGPLACPLPLLRRLRAQPHRDVGRLHRLPHYSYKLGVQSVEIGLIAQRCREGF